MGASFAAVFLLARLALGDLRQVFSILRTAAGAGLLGLSLGAFLLLPQALAISGVYTAGLCTSRGPTGRRSFPGSRTAPIGRRASSRRFSRARWVMASMICRLPEISRRTPRWRWATLAWSAGRRRSWSCGLPRSKRPRPGALVLLAAAGLGIATGTLPFAEIQGHVPALRLLFPVRLLSWTRACGQRASRSGDRPAAQGSRRFQPACDFRGRPGRGPDAGGPGTYAHFAPAYRQSGGIAGEWNAEAWSCGGLGLFAVLVAGSACAGPER